MSVYKEGYHTVNLIQMNQRKIWNDSTTTGALSRKDDSLWKWVQQTIQWYGIPGTRTVTPNQDVYDGVLISTTLIEQAISLIDEWGTRSPELFWISYTKRSHMPADYDGFFSVRPVINPIEIKQLLALEKQQYQDTIQQ